MFSINLMNIDTYQAFPIPELDVTFSEFRGSEIRKVPVIRIFGSTATGKKTCLHVHGVFPYIYVLCTVEENINSYAYQLAASIDSALNASFGSTLSTSQHVYKIQQVSGIPFYGYHEKEHLFLKVYFYNPAIIKKTADLLQNGIIFNQNLQPYEAHIPYILQFMIDYNLYGMNLINLSNVKYRHSLQECAAEDSQEKTSMNLLDSQAYLPISVMRQSMCELEVDAHASDILNKQSINEKLELNPGLAAIWEEEKARRTAAGLENTKSQLVYSRTSNEISLPPTDNDIYQEGQLLKRLDAISQTNETIISNISASSYPIEIEDNEKFLNASHVLNHGGSSAPEENIEKKVLNDNKLSQSVSFLAPNQSQNNITDTSFLNADDMQLVEMLADLAEENEITSNVDNDSVLGSQYSVLNEPAKNELEEEDNEDLNITSLDLGSMSSWESTYQRFNPGDNVEFVNNENNRTCLNDSNIKENDKDVTLINIPQFDGVDDLYENMLEDERETVNCFNDKDIACCAIIHYPSKNIKHAMSVINIAKNYTYTIYNLHRNSHLMDIIGYIVNNPNKYYLKIQLHNFLNRFYFHIFVKTSKILQINNSNIDTSVVVTKRYCSPDKEKRIVYNKKIEEELHVARYQLQSDHRDLDVYDIDEIEETLEDINIQYILNYEEKKYIYERNSRSYFQQDFLNSHCLSHNLSNFSEFTVPAFDGATGSSDSESEIEVDVTVDKQEKRACSYKSCKKSTLQNTVQITPKKRRKRLDSNDDDCESFSKRRNMDIRTPKKYDSPSKMLRNPQYLSGNYSPLSITITSPKISKSPIRESLQTEQKSDVLSCTTPKHKAHSLRGKLLREKRVIQENINIDDIHEKTMTNKINFHNTDVNFAKSNKTTAACELVQNHKQRTENNEISLKGSKEVRKQLYFYDEIENTFTESDHHASQSENLFGHMVHQSHAAAIVFSSSNESSEDIVPSSQHMEKSNNDISPDRKYASSVRNLVNKSTRFQCDIIPESDDENEEDVCNTTFTRYIDQKIESDSQNFSSERNIYQTSKNTLITITTKYKPPSFERILESMSLYGIPKCRWEKPFFSDKLDLARQKESLNASVLHFDVPAFKSSLEEITSIKLWRRMKVNEFYPSGSSIKTHNLKRTLAGCNLLTIKPLIVPPSSKDVTNWIKAKKYFSEQNVKLHKGQKEKMLLDIKNIHSSTNINDKSQPGTSKFIIDNLNTEKFISSMLQQNLLNQTPDDSRKFDYTQSCSGDSQHSQASGDILNPSLQKALKNPLLYNQNKTEQIRVSYGQIEYSSKGSYSSITNQNLQNVRAVTAYQYLTLLTLEVHVVTRDDLLPDPQYDSIAALFYAIYSDIPTDASEQIEHGAIIVNSCPINTKLNKIHSASVMCPILYVATEKDLLDNLVKLINQHNPDILLGWEVEMLSWGYVFQRVSHLALTGFPLKISKVPYMQMPSRPDANILEKDDISEIKVPGRNILDVWRIMRHEAALLSYTFENVMYHILHERIPCPSFKTLSTWWKDENMITKCRVIHHYVTKVKSTLKILNHLDIIGRTCEYARLFGIQFYEVFSRGSQFRVESMMLRLAKPLNYIPISPSMQQRAKMRAPECLPLIMEPESEFYTDPLIVLDFQSLYPSMIIAYNYCFSTCLGRIEHIGQYGPFEFGAATLRVKKNTALKLQDKMNFSPCGVAFVKKEVRQGILPRMLTEILNTRLMVKESMKLHPAENRTLQRVLHSQQLGLKLIANVTYGYTSANFSGRMPCIEIGDSVVSKGRETLERAIKLVEFTPKWGARVIYGDTDSIFVLLPGKSREEAFTIGEEIADAVTAINPPPVKLKFEKVLHPSILQTKKRYCGYMYETRNQEKPEFLAKGIETVRRDGCPAVSKILEKALKILFDTKDISLVKLYIVRQFDKIFRRRVSIQDLTFAKEFRGMRGYKANACVPALELTRRLIRKDPRAVPRTSERVRYIIVAGAPNQALIHCVRTPIEVLADPALIPNSVYYITKVIIPPLNRCFHLFGIDINMWYKEMSHRQSFDNIMHLDSNNPKSTIRQFFSSVACVTCGEQTNKDICTECLSQPSRTILVLLEKIRQLQRTHQQIAVICHSCMGRLGDIECVSLDCPVLYRTFQARKELAQVSYMNNIIYGDNSSGIKGLHAVAEWY